MPNLTQDYERLVNQAIVELPGASDAGIRQALFEVFHEFFNETLCWRESVSVSIVAGTVTYNLTLAEGGEFIMLISLVNSNNSPQAAVSDLVGTITLRNTPISAGTFTAVVAKTIGIPVDREGKPMIPEWTISRFEPIIIAGLLGRLMMQPKKPYSDTSKATYHLKRFRNQMGNVKSAVLHGNLQGANTWRYPQAFATRGQRSVSGTDQSFGG